MVTGIALIKFVLQMAVAHRYGIFRDEM